MATYHKYTAIVTNALREQDIKVTLRDVDYYMKGGSINTDEQRKLVDAITATLVKMNVAQKDVKWIELPKQQPVEQTTSSEASPATQKHTPPKSKVAASTNTQTKTKTQGADTIYALVLRGECPHCRTMTLSKPEQTKGGQGGGFWSTCSKCGHRFYRRETNGHGATCDTCRKERKSKGAK